MLVFTKGQLLPRGTAVVKMVETILIVSSGRLASRNEKGATKEEVLSKAYIYRVLKVPLVQEMSDTCSLRNIAA